MGSSYKTKAVYFLITDKAVYRSDAILEQIDEWIEAFTIGHLIPASADPESLDEYEAYLTEVIFENKKLTREDVDAQF